MSNFQYKMNYYEYKTPLGYVMIASDNRYKAITMMKLDNGYLIKDDTKPNSPFPVFVSEFSPDDIRSITNAEPDMEVIYQPSNLTELAAIQLGEYFYDGRRKFDLPLRPNKGTKFQHSVWNALLTIPYGETRSYKQIAEQIGSPKACRAVGLANNKNPIWIVIPCHRVIGSDGSLTGYGGGLDVKKKLLKLEMDGELLS